MGLIELGGISPIFYFHSTTLKLAPPRMPIIGASILQPLPRRPHPPRRRPAKSRAEIDPTTCKFRHDGSAARNLRGPRRTESFTTHTSTQPRSETRKKIDLGTRGRADRPGSAVKNAPSNSIFFFFFFDQIRRGGGYLGQLGLQTAR